MGNRTRVRRPTTRTRLKSNVSVPKLILLVFLLVLTVAMARMVIVMVGRSSMAIERRDAAKAELADIEQLADSLQAEADNLNTEAGLASTLRERYGLVSENEGYLILVREPEQSEDPGETTESWWPLW